LPRLGTSSKSSTGASALVDAANAFDHSLRRFADLVDVLSKAKLNSRHGLERAAEGLSELARCEGNLQAQAQALVGALGAARDAQQAQTEVVRARALEIQQRTGEYAAIMGRFEALGSDAAELNAMAQQLAGRRSAGDTDQPVREGELPSLLSALNELQERTSAVASTGASLAADARAADFEELFRKVDSLRQQLLATRDRIGVLKESLVRIVPTSQMS
jgi:chromosome segregation ATPase